MIICCAWSLRQLTVRSMLSFRNSTGSLDCTIQHVEPVVFRRREVNKLLRFLNALSMSAALFIVSSGVSICAPFALIGFSGSLGSVGIYDLETNTLVKAITGFVGPYQMAFSRDGNVVYVADNALLQVGIIDYRASPSLVSARIPVGFSPAGITITPDDRTLYVSVGESVAVIDTGSREIMSWISVGASVGQLAVNPSGTALYVCGVDDKQCVRDLDGNELGCSDGSGRQWTTRYCDHPGRLGRIRCQY
jgi:hypothetical protein